MVRMLSGLDEFVASWNPFFTVREIPPFLNRAMSLVTYSVSALFASRKRNSEEENPNHPFNIDDHFVKIKQTNIECDLQEADWINTVNHIESALQSIYHPGITYEAIEKFKQDMFKEGGFTLINLRKSIRRNFAVGHLGVMRTACNFAEMREIIRTKHPSKTDVHFRIEGYKGNMYIYLNDPKFISFEEIEKHKKNFHKLSIKLLKTQKRIIPLITIHSFKRRKGAFVQEIKTITKTIGRKYKHLILDLRGNSGGKIEMMYYFLSLFLGKNDPDIYALKIRPEHQKLSKATLEKEIRPVSFYENLVYDGKLELKKDISKKLFFKKMIVLIDKKTFSGGEIAAAALKSSLGSKVCILGKPGRGSFEQAGMILDLPDQFKLALPEKDIIFFSKKYRKILTGHRLLPDILHENMETIVDKALDIFNGKISWSNIPSYEPMVL